MTATVTGSTASRAVSAAVLADWQKATATASDCRSSLFLLLGCDPSWCFASRLLLARVGDVVVSVPALASRRYKRLLDVVTSVLAADLGGSPRFLGRMCRTTLKTGFLLTLVDACVGDFHRQAVTSRSLIVLFWFGVENTEAKIRSGPPQALRFPTIPTYCKDI